LPAWNYTLYPVRQKSSSSCSLKWDSRRQQFTLQFLGPSRGKLAAQERALEEAYKVGQKPVGADMIDNVLAKDINGLEPRLTRQGYNAKVLADSELIYSGSSKQTKLSPRSAIQRSSLCSIRIKVHLQRIPEFHYSSAPSPSCFLLTSAFLAEMRSSETKEREGHTHRSSFSIILVYGRCFWAVLKQCGLILTECGPEDFLILK
jgi:hypothetical protein